ncbi:replisome organizer [Lactiplantibacillus plantarum]|uniref:replisome organizer n=1 Tax=Lactiplantibacillus plantarum TaxID=1590 RepID=UPI0011C84C87|nr:replisome organizer [Lactiplantibacillus plantarum]MDO8180249.1 replisome organizer [Lactiplantibacillus plantarum]TXJ89404.1 replisome organizer [Lactiplantibacillus plantarum]
MAQRRMFSNRITDSAKFLKMPLSSQALYFHLGLHADDDGVVEAFSVMRQTGAVEDDLRILVAKNFVNVLNDDLVAYITDWNENNRIRADRKVDSIYKDLLLEILPNIELTEPKPRADTGKVTGRPMDNQWTDNGPHRLGKDRLGKDSKGKYIESVKPKPGKAKPARHKYGQYQNVLLTDEQLAKLKSEFPKDWQDRIERVSGYVQSSGKHYKDYLATIRNWAKRDQQSNQSNKVAPQTREDWFG